MKKTKSRSNKSSSIKANKNDIAIQLNTIFKTYILHHEKPTFSEQIIRRRKKEIFTALKGVNLTIHKGEKVGIIGPNGSGKTTLLKIIARITTPDSGSIYTNGKVVSLINLEAGFHPELTGEENIFLNGLLLGMSKKEISERFQAIIEFADIGSFIDAPLYTYSSGMKLRLGFAVAINSDPDILLLDEGIVVGDANFQKKVENYIQEIFKQNKTIIIVSHWQEFLNTNCSRIISLPEINQK